MSQGPSTAGETGARLGLRRLGLLALALATVAWCGRQSWGLLAANGLSLLEGVLFGLSLILFLPLAFYFWLAMVGGVALLVRRRRAAAPAISLEPWPEDLQVALVMPIYNEEPGRVFAGLQATYESVRAAGKLSGFDFFVLSDTNDPEVWLREERAFERLRRTVSDPRRVHYRNRPVNAGRKAGNLEDFCERWGHRYRYMVVLDADSVLDGASVVELVRLMEKDPRAGIIQAPPVTVGRRTLFGRVQQFATSAYGRLSVLGLDVWQGAEGNYWGHNAIVRVEPFVQHCRLPVLPGKEPLGGQILSHDFVEAALMIRAGWKVYLAPDVRGSYEETPPSLIDHAARDRRWCQGNLQHLRLLRHPGLKAISRFHFTVGALAYLTSPIWLATLVLGTVEALRQGLTPHEYFPQQTTLFPVWREDLLPRSIALLATVAVLLFLPKLLGLLHCLLDPELRRGHGGPRRVLASSAFEGLFSLLLAPVMAVLHSRFVLLTFLGRKVEWNAQERSEVGTGFAEALRRHGGTMALGVFWTVAVYRLLPELLPWLAPVLLGFLLAVPLSVWSSRVSAGRRALDRGLLGTPEELDPPPVLRRLNELLAEPAPATPVRDALDWVLADPSLRELHLALNPQRPRDPLASHHLEGLRLKRRLQGPAALTRAERRELLQDPASIRELAGERPAPAPLAAPV